MEVKFTIKKLRKMLKSFDFDSKCSVSTNDFEYVIATTESSMSFKQLKIRMKYIVYCCQKDVYLLKKNNYRHLLMTKRFFLTTSVKEFG